jgi:hypothetical protein
MSNSRDFDFARPSEPIEAIPASLPPGSAESRSAEYLAIRCPGPMCRGITPSIGAADHSERLGGSAAHFDLRFRFQRFACSRTVDIRPMVPLQPSALALLLFSRMKE